MAKAKWFGSSSRWTDSIKNLLHHPLSARVFLVTALIATGIAWQLSNASIRKRAEDRFRFRAQELYSEVEKRMFEYEQVLRGGQGLFVASKNVTRQEWKDYVQTLHLQEYFPGIQGFGYAPVIHPKSLDLHVKTIKSEGFPQYSLWPPGPRDLYTAIVYLEPFEGRNLRAFGYDMFADPVRRSAMERARDTAKTAISGSVALVQETNVDVQTGFLMYLPVYRPGASLGTLEERRANLMGFVYSPFRMDDLMTGILGKNFEGLRFEIYDTEKTESSTLMFKSDTREKNYKAAFQQSMKLMIGGRTWTLNASSTPAAFFSEERVQPWVIALVGLTIDFLAFGLIRNMARRHREALKVASEMTLALAKSQERFELAISGSQDGIWDWDLKTNEVYYSPKWKNLLGYDDHEISNHFDSWVKLLHPEDRERAFQTIEDYFSGKMTDYLLEHRLRTKDGTYRWILARAVALRDKNNKPFRMAGSHRDITERKETELLLIRAKDEAVAATNAKSQFLANMSHEIRTPLNGIVGMSKLLMNSKLSSSQEEYVETILQSSNHLQSIVNDILDLSKIEANKLDLEVTDIDLKELLTSIYKATKILAKEKNIHLETQLLNEKFLWFKGDFIRIQQVLLNLVHNAIKFTEKGQVSVSVSVSYSKTSPQRYLLHFEVQDTGIGISDTALQNIFEPFVQADTSITRKHGGTGLGLSICKRLVSLMGGTIGVESQLHQGSKFYFEIPVEESKMVPHSQAAGMRQTLLKSEKHLKILVAEDQTTNQKVIERMLRLFGHEVDLVKNGREALHALTNKSYDLVLLDCHMPEMDGFSTASAIRAQGNSIPIIALTADVLSETKARCLQTGMNALVAKPLDAETLFVEIEKVISSPLETSLLPAKKDLLEIIDLKAHDNLRVLNQPGMEDIVMELIQDYLKKTPDKLAVIEVGLKTKDLKQVFSQAHALKSLAGAIGARRVEKVAAELEKTARANQAAESQEIFHRLVENIEVTHSHLIQQFEI